MRALVVAAAGVPRCDHRTSSPQAKPGPAAADHRAPADCAEEATVQRIRPFDVRRPLSTVSGYTRCARGRPAGDRHSLAPSGVQSVLALAIEASPGETNGAGRDPPIDPRDEPCQSAVGSPADSWRVFRRVVTEGIADRTPNLRAS